MIMALGIILNWLGVIVLFFFAMPYRIGPEGRNMIRLEREDASEDIKKDRLFRRLSLLGLGLISVGTLLQVAPIAFPSLGA